MLEIQVTEQEFIDFMNSEDETADIFTDDALVLLYDYLYYRTEDTEEKNKKKILDEWEEYENREEAEKAFSRHTKERKLEDQTVVLKGANNHLLDGDSTIVLVKVF